MNTFVFTPGNKIREGKTATATSLKSLFTADYKPEAAKLVGSGVVMVRMNTGDYDYYVKYTQSIRNVLKPYGIHI